MRIIKEGCTPNPLRVFHCIFCGCVFEADENEYNGILTPRNELLYICHCPHCSKKVYADEDSN